MSVVLPRTQPDRLLRLLKRRGMARLSEIEAAGITAASAARLVRDGRVVRLARGLYQLPDAPLDAHHSLAQAAKRVPRGVVCLASALAFHDLTDQIPPKVWIAIGQKDWVPRVDYPPLRIAKFPERHLKRDVESHRIEGVMVSIYGISKSLADAFRYRRELGIPLCVEALSAALRKGKATPADIARTAERDGVWKAMQPYLEALTING